MATDNRAAQHEPQAPIAGAPPPRGARSWAIARQAHTGETRTTSVLATDMAMEPAAQGLGRVGSTAGLEPISPARSAMPAVSGRAYGEAKAPEASSPHASMRFGGMRAGAAEAKGAYENVALRDVNALKLVTQLAASVAFEPGSAADPQRKRDRLARLLVLSDELGQRLVQACGHERGGGWMRAMAREAAGKAIAARVERAWGQALPGSDAARDEARPGQMDEAQKVEAQKDRGQGGEAGLREGVEAACAVLEQWRAAPADAPLATALNDIEQAGWRDVESREDQQARVRHAVTLALWTLHDAATDERLGRGSYRFSWGRPAEGVVSTLGAMLNKVACEMVPSTDDHTVRVMYLQSLVGRLAMLIKTEYVAHTRKAMDWIADERISDEEYLRRKQDAHAKFEEFVLPTIEARVRAVAGEIELAAPEMVRQILAHAAEQASASGPTSERDRTKSRDAAQASTDSMDR